MKIAMVCAHTGSGGIKPSGQHGGGELHTFAFLSILNKVYDVLAVTPNGFYPAFDTASDYGFDLSDIKWKPLGADLDWLRQFDVMIAMDHGRLYPPVCTRNILSVFFPQYPAWDVGGYDTIIANSDYTASWIKRYWGRDALTVYPPVALANLVEAAGEYEKKKRITAVGRFFRVPGGNNKNHATLVKAFKKMMLPDWELVLVGALQDKVYYDEIVELIGNDGRIKIVHDLTREEYARNLGESTFVWAATGYSGDNSTELPPSSREHFGIFPVEAAALHTIPMVHNSGGTPEGPVLTWDTPRDLVEMTRDYIENQDKRLPVMYDLHAKALGFDFHEQAKALLSVIERPVIILPDPVKVKAFASAPDRKNITVGMISDSPTITTGFSNLTRMIGSGLAAKGYRIKVLGMQDLHFGPPHYNDELYTWRGWPGIPYTDLIKRFVNDESVDVIYVNYDPGNIRLVFDVLMSERIDKPVVAYMPIESAPIIPQMVDTIRLARLFNGEVVLYTKWAVDQVQAAGGPRCTYVHHGADHADFAPPPPGYAEEMRAAMGWQEKFVVVNVGRNKRTKNIVSLLDVAEILKGWGQNDIVFYIHTSLAENIPNSSLPLDEAATTRGVEDRVYFPEDLAEQTQGVPYTTPRDIFVKETDSPRRLQDYTLAAMTFVERLWLAAPHGAYANASLAEGFGLTPIEAMACGVPIVSVDDNGVQREVLGGAPLYVPGDRKEYWNTGGELWNFDPEKMARALLAIRDGDVDRNELIKDGLNQASKYKWSDTVEVIDGAILRRITI